jgi:hypothetical protein
MEQCPWILFRRKVALWGTLHHRNEIYPDKNYVLFASVHYFLQHAELSPLSTVPSVSLVCYIVSLTDNKPTTVTCSMTSKPLITVQLQQVLRTLELMKVMITSRLYAHKPIRHSVYFPYKIYRFSIVNKGVDRETGNSACQISPLPLRYDKHVELNSTTFPGMRQFTGLSHLWRWGHPLWCTRLETWMDFKVYMFLTNINLFYDS